MCTVRHTRQAHNLSPWQHTMHDKANAVLWCVPREEKWNSWETPFGEREEEEDEDEEGEPRYLIQGPASQVFPAESGWEPQLYASPADVYKIKSLAQVTIKRVTKLLTAQHTVDQRPNCEMNWQARFTGISRYRLGRSGAR
jgi:hypothetical protein